MSAPAGWHQQPDGRERFWDGTRWTDRFRSPATDHLQDPTAPPEASWTTVDGDDSGDPTAPGPEPTAVQDRPDADQTQVLDVSGTQAIPSYPPQQAATAPPYPPPAYGQPTDVPPAYATPTYPPPAYAPPTGYGAPGSQPYAPPPRQGGGLARGCLLAGLVGLLVLGTAVVGGIYLFNRTVDAVSESFPSGLPSGLPTDFPSDLPTGLPTEGLGEAVAVSVGGEFELPRARVLSGWSLEPQGSGIPIVNVVGMRADIPSGDRVPVLFSLSFPDSGGTQVETLCTAASGSSDAPVEVSCVPFFGDVSRATRGTVTAAL